LPRALGPRAPRPRREGGYRRDQPRPARRAGLRGSDQGPRRRRVRPRRGHGHRRRQGARAGRPGDGRERGRGLREGPTGDRAVLEPRFRLALGRRDGRSERAAGVSDEEAIMTLRSLLTSVSIVVAAVLLLVAPVREVSAQGDQVTWGV